MLNNEIKDSLGNSCDSVIDMDIFSLNEEETNIIKTENEEDENFRQSLDFKHNLKDYNIDLKIEKENEPQLIENTKYFFPKPPIPKPKKSNEEVSPMKLCLKLYDNNNFLEKKIKEVLYDYEKDNNDCLSCPDEDMSNLDDNDTQDMTPKQSSRLFVELRKDMKKEKNKIDENLKNNEYENILSMDKIFNKTKKRKKMKSIWKKYIQTQEENNWLFTYGFLSSLNNNLGIDQRTISIPLYRTKTEGVVVKNRLRNSYISIFGLLESAANETKERYTVDIL